MSSFKFKVLIGGIGDDAHSVGIRLLELGFREAGFFVKSLGIRNQIQDFFDHAKDYDIILVSNKNGHSELYLNDFPRLIFEYKLTDNSPKLWYLGGSLSVSENAFEVKKRFLNMGFTNIYPKPIAFGEVLQDIKIDIIRNNIKERHIAAELNRPLHDLAPLPCHNILDRKLTTEELFKMRSDVLLEWPTGTQVLSHPAKCIGSLDSLLWKNHLTGDIPLFQPRTGVADIKEQISLLQYLEGVGSDISSVQLDSASRSKFYEKAILGRDASIERKNSVLNGFPVPVYGVDGIKKLVRALKNPFQLRGGGPDHRFTYEIALEGGASGVEGGFICYLLPYDKLCTPVESFNNWQYIDRLCAHFEEQHQLTINREYFGVLTASLIEPSLAIVVNVIQSILSAQQGCKSISVGYAEQGNRSQDIAAVQVMTEMVSYYLELYNFRECRVTTVFHQFMAAFPQDYVKSEELIYQSCVTATLARATKVMVKTAAEAFNIPDRYDNEKALKLCRTAAISAYSAKVSFPQIAVEKEIIKKEVKAIMKAVIELGNNSVALGAIKAIECGIIDIPFSPNLYNKNKVMGIRDITGAVRFLDFGNLPFDSNIKEFHQERINTRTVMERDSNLFSLVEKDLSRIWKNDYKSWPLDDHYIN
ncbi:methylaspartate mutase subunit E [Mucilaginibacter sp. RCC_168]|uniref:methylaspartate mutase subunit E n=1 Tax=Mucilaginibacter sp. RCC_168 TaxID=3239221 RepID=UPI003524D1F8